MLVWKDILHFAKNGAPSPDFRLEKPKEAWAKILTEEQFRITRLQGTEHAHSGEYCGVFEWALYACVCCGALLFDAREKFESGSGWPSFTQSIKENSIKYVLDTSHGMTRVETQCNTCDAHLGHVFPDGPEPSGLRYCINSVALQKVEAAEKTESVATFGGGCFWCTEALFESLKGVKSVISGYSGGKTENPDYKQVCTGTTGHAEVVQIRFDSEIISYEDLLRMHLLTHDPTTLNRQGGDEGTQYRSVIFYHNEEQKRVAQRIVKEIAGHYKSPVVTEIQALVKFYPAEDYHQDYFARNTNQPYCQFVISPKLDKLKEKYQERLK